MRAVPGLGPEGEWPSTGAGGEGERRRAAARIVWDTSGTRCSTVLLQGADRTMSFAERTYGPQGVELDTVRFEFRLAG